VRKLAASFVSISAFAGALVASSLALAQGEDPPPSSESEAPPPDDGPAAGGVNPLAPQAEDKPDLGDSAGAPAAAAPEAPRLPPGAPMSDATAKQRYEAMSDMVQAFEREARETRDEIRRIAERKYKERRQKIEDNYRRMLEPVTKAERDERQNAIAAFEAFLQRHPNDREFTPDAIFRLAELYYEKYDDDHQTAMREFKDAYKAWEDGGKKGEPPGEPQRRFDNTIALYQRLIAEYPDYRLIDGAYYLLGYTQRAQGDIEPGVQTWLTLVQRFPNSRFYPEVWFRIGDQRFDDERWDDAIAAFTNVMPMKDSEFYDKALYKLAWTYYLVNRFDDSVGRFFELLEYSYANRGKEGEAGSVLEEESVQYVAISFGDDNWRRPDAYYRLIKGASLEDPDAEKETFYVAFTKDKLKEQQQKQGGAGARPFERDVLARLGDNLFKQSKHAQAVEALEAAITLDPLHKDAPKLQDQIVQAWVRERQFDKANAARDLLVKNYAPGTAWGKRHANDSEALNSAETFARTNLYQAALYYHQQATQYFNDNRQDLGVQYFKAASDAYKTYLDRYPHDKNAYELSYYLAETYYYSLRFEEAVAAYETVRDSPAGTKYRAEGALASVYSYEKIIDLAVQTGKLEKKEIFAGKREEAQKPQEIPELRKRYVNAIDKFLERGGEHEMASAFGYRAGEVFYSYGHWDEAVKRFQIVVDRYPQTEAAKFAANLILDDLLAKKDWQGAATYAAKFEANKVGGGSTDEFAKIKGGAQFNIAKSTLEQGAKLLDEGKIQEGNAMLESGADQYLALLQQDPKREFADVMLYNAALSLEKARRPVRAAGLYERLYKEYPDSEKAPEAMFRVASKSEQAFQFDKAVETYIGLVKQYPKSERRADAQINAALALEGQQKYERAAAELEKFSTLFPERPEAPDVFYRASIVHKKRKNAAAELDVLNRFIKRYGGASAQTPRVIEAYARMGEIYDELAADSRPAENKKKAVDMHKAAVARFQGARGSPTAAYFAAKSAFSLAENSYASYARLGIFSKNSKQQVKELEGKSKRLSEVETELKAIITTYKAAEWSLASLYRIGSLYDNMQQTVLKSPCPDDVRRIAGDVACDEYRNLIEDQAFAVENKAVEAYKTAHNKALELRLTNAWTRRTLEALNLLRPQEFPIDKEPLHKPARGESTAVGAALPDGGAGQLKAVGPGPAELAQKTGAAG
jgi:cellulose synthase operon protein C